MPYADATETLDDKIIAATPERRKLGDEPRRRTPLRRRRSTPWRVGMFMTTNCGWENRRSKVSVRSDAGGFRASTSRIFGRDATAEKVLSRVVAPRRVLEILLFSDLGIRRDGTRRDKALACEPRERVSRGGELPMWSEDDAKGRSTSEARGRVARRALRRRKRRTDRAMSRWRRRPASQRRRRRASDGRTKAVSVVMQMGAHRSGSSVFRAWISRADDACREALECEESGQNSVTSITRKNIEYSTS